MSQFSFSNPEQESKYQEILKTFPPSKLILFEDQLDDIDLRAIFLSGVEFGTGFKSLKLGTSYTMVEGKIVEASSDVYTRA